MATNIRLTEFERARRDVDLLQGEQRQRATEELRRLYPEFDVDAREPLRDMATKLRGGEPESLHLRPPTAGLAKVAQTARTVAPRSEIRELASVNDVPTVLQGLKGRTLYVTDLDYTVMTTKGALGRDAWYEDLIHRRRASGDTPQAAEAHADNIWLMVQQTQPMMPIEPGTVGALTALGKDTTLLALTARDLRMVDTTPKQLDALGLNLRGGDVLPSYRGPLSNVSDFRDGVLTVKPGQNKGQHLVDFIGRFGLRFDNIVMADDKAKNLVDTRDALAARGIPFIGLHYQRGLELDKGLDLARARADEAQLLDDARRAAGSVEVREVIDAAKRRALADDPGAVQRETLPREPELDTKPHTLNQSASDFKVGTSYEIQGSEWYNRYNEPLYGPMLNGSIANIIFAPRMGEKEMMRVAQTVPDPRNPNRSYAALTNANGDVYYVSFNGKDHKSATTFTPVSTDDAPAELRHWSSGPTIDVDAPKLSLDRDVPEQRQELVARMVAAQERLSGTARRSEDLRRQVTTNLTAMNTTLLSRLKDGLTVDDLELANTTATQGNAHYGDDLENVRGVVRGSSRIIERADGTRERVGNDEALESTVALRFSPPHLATPETQRLVADINKIDRTTSLPDIARLYQRLILTHPFSDGTGRTSFGVLDYMLVRSGREPLPHTEESGIPLFKTVPELVAEFRRAYANR